MKCHWIKNNAQYKYYMGFAVGVLSSSTFFFLTVVFIESMPFAQHEIIFNATGDWKKSRNQSTLHCYTSSLTLQHEMQW